MTRILDAGSCMTLKTLRSLLTLVVLCSLAVTVNAEVYNDELVCRAPTDKLSPTEYLRALGRDLTGNLPTAGELEAVRNEGMVPDA